MPIHLRSEVEAELNGMLEQGHIERVPTNEPTSRVSPLTLVRKPDKTLRLCTDNQQANRAIRRERHPMMTVDDIRYALNGAKLLSKLDLNKAYNQLELHPDSRSITTFTTHVGLFRYRRLFFGLISAAEIFQHAISSLLRDIANQINVADDILVYGTNPEEHDLAFARVLNRLEEFGASLNKKKCEFRKSEITFFGMRFSGEGMAHKHHQEPMVFGENASQEIRAHANVAGGSRRRH